MTATLNRGAIRALYLLVFLFVGGQGNYFTLWLSDAGWGEAQIGGLDAIRYGAILVFPLFWGAFTDRHGRPLRTLRWIALGSLLCFLPLTITTAPIPVFLAIACFSAFRVGIVPVADTLTLGHLEDHGGDYGRIRIWGSWGFVIGGFVLAAIVNGFGRAAVPLALTASLALTAILVFSRRGPTLDPSASAPRQSLRAVLTTPGLRPVLAVAFLWRLAGQGLYSFLPLHLADLGVSDTLLPVYWAAGVLSEIVLLHNAQRLFGRFARQSVIRFAIAAATLQYALTAYVRSPLWLLPVMLLHGVSFGVAYYSVVLWLGENVPPRSRATAQALFQSLSFGLAGALSAAGCGLLFQSGRGPLMYATAAALSAATLVLGAALPRRQPTSSR